VADAVVVVVVVVVGTDHPHIVHDAVLVGAEVPSADVDVIVIVVVVEVDHVQ
jgi:hypothetical protein